MIELLLLVACLLAFCAFGGKLIVFGQQSLVKPFDKQNGQLWKGCEDMQPISKDEDDAYSSLCTDMQGRKWEVMYRKLSRACHETTVAKPDGYQHFECSELFELLIKPHKKEK